MIYRTVRVSNVEDYLSQGIGDNAHGGMKFTKEDGSPAPVWYLHSIIPSISITDKDGKCKIEQWLVILYSDESKSK